MFTSGVVFRSNYFGIDGKVLKLKKQNWSTFSTLDAIYFKNPKILTWIAFPEKIPLILSS